MILLQLEIPILPKTPNQLLGAHWRVRSKNSKDITQAVWAAIKFQKLNFKVLKKAKLTLVRQSSNEPDADGLVGSFKPVIDALVKCGVLEDDKMSNIGMPDYKWVKAPRNKGSITVIVESIE